MDVGSILKEGLTHTEIYSVLKIRVFKNEQQGGKVCISCEYTEPVRAKIITLLIELSNLSSYQNFPRVSIFYFFQFNPNSPFKHLLDLNA